MTPDEVAQHTGPSDLWVTYKNNVYNVSEFAKEHPGGEDLLLDKAGQDITQDFEDVGHSPYAEETLQKLLVGPLTQPSATKDCTLVQVVKENQEFSSHLSNYMQKEWKLDGQGFNYHVLAVFGSQSTGKSACLHL
jgi:cytochrome b involved in lipid metabolism